MTAPDFSGALWVKSSRSAEDNNCVELCLDTARPGIRDSKSPSGAALAFQAAAIKTFISSAKHTK